MVNLLTAIRLRVARSRRVIDALDGVRTESSAVAAEPDARVMVGWPDERKAAGTVFMFENGDVVNKEIPRSDESLSFTAFACSLAEVKRIIEAVGREFADRTKGCPVVVPPPIAKAKTMFWTSHGAAERETDELRLWKTEGTLQVTWLVQPQT
jgi:hypothetical protein